MKTLINKLKSTAIMVTTFALGISQASASGLLSAKGSNTDLEIRDHTVSVAVEDGYAITTVENTFFNSSSRDLEAVYEFPVPKNGTVAEFTIWIDGKPVIGEVVEKERAQKLYKQEQAAGRDVGLTEKKSFYRFESSVSPVRANQATKTRLVYMQPADIQGGIGRYVYPLEEGGTDQDKLNFWQTDERVTGAFSFDFKLRSSFPVDALRAPAHPHAVVNNADTSNWQLTINKTGQSKANSNLSEAELNEDSTIDVTQRTSVFSDLEVQPENNRHSSNQLNQDLVIYWRLRPNLPGSVELVAHKEPGKRRGTFMLTVTPGIDLQAITEGRDWVFVLDRSGSMQGKYQTLMDATAQALKSLGQQDRFKVVLFNNQVEELTSDWATVDQLSIAKISEALNRSQPGGGTDMYAGIEAGLRGLDADRTASIILVTDGVANLGKTEKKDFLDLMSKHDVRLFTAIMGNGANRPLLDSMTKVSQGFATSVANSDDVMGILISATEKVKFQALHDVELKIKGLKTADIVPTQNTTVYRGQQIVMFGHYFGDDEAEVVLKAKISGEPKEYRTKFSFPKVATDNPEIERLWAFAQIQEIKDRADYLGESAQDHRAAIVETATEYGLVTDFTSMIVMSDEQFEANNIERKNRSRRAKETTAAQKRKANPVSSNQVDQNQPAFSGKRTSYKGSGGGGAFGPIGFLIFLPLCFAWFRKRKTFH